jgi:nucleotide-binding universal stress UspA family protein
MISDDSLADGIINEIKNDSNVKLLLLKWPKDEGAKLTFITSLEKIIADGNVNFGVLYDREIKGFKNIMVPVGGGYHSRLAIHLANDIATQENGSVDYFRILPVKEDEEGSQDQIAYLQEIVMTELDQIPNNASLQVIHSDSVADAVIHESQGNEYDLIIMGSSEEEEKDGSIFGKLCDQITEKAGCSVLVIRQHESQAASWLRRQIKRREK